ncbi:MAG: glycosyltransferase, partial [Bacteroidales bacterium]|nr:glycosyltransferase [Bacteroidales bacterium]
MIDQTTLDKKPLISFTLFAYNQEKYIQEAVEGALSQTYSPLEIVISDDCSTDRTFEIIKELTEDYSGPHK